MSIETTSCVMCGYTLLLIDSETQTCINCNTEREFKRVMDSIDYVGCRECGREIVVDKSDPIDSQLCDNCNGEY